MLARCQFGLHEDGTCGAMLTYPIKGYPSLPVQDAEVHGAGVQVDPTINPVRLGVESPEVSSS
jgi:hypothetical protein